MPTASMFHPAAVQIAQRVRQPNQVRSLFSSTIHRPGHDSLRRGILFIIISVVCLLVGGILTWLGFNDVFGGKASMTGPLLIALAVLLLLFSTRQFTLAKKRNFEAGRIQPIGRGAVAALVIDGDDNIGAVTVILDNNGPLDDIDPDSYESRAMPLDNAPPSYIEATAMPHCLIAPSNRQQGQHSPGGPLPDSEPPPSYDEAIDALVNQNQITGTSNRQQGISFVTAGAANQIPAMAGVWGTAVPHNHTITAVHVTVSTANFMQDNNNSVHLDQHVDLDSINNNDDRNRNQNRMENG